MRLKLLLVRVPDWYIKALKTLVKAGRYNNVSVAVRIALREFLVRELREVEEVRRELEAPFTLPDKGR